MLNSSFTERGVLKQKCTEASEGWVQWTQVRADDNYLHGLNIYET